MQLIKILDMCFTTVIVVDEGDSKQPRSGPMHRSICQLQLEPPQLQQIKRVVGHLILGISYTSSAAVGQPVVVQPYNSLHSTTLNKTHKTKNYETYI